MMFVVEAGTITAGAAREAVVATAEREVNNWSTDLFETEHLVLEKDLLHGKKLMARLRAQTADLQVGEEEAVGSTTNSLKIENKTLRLCCEHAAVIRYAMLTNPSNKRIVETVLGAVSHIKAWRTRAATHCVADTRFSEEPADVPWQIQL